MGLRAGTLVLLLAGCQCEPDVLREPCAGPVADPLCGASCTDDDDCGSRLFCGVDGRCTAECGEGVGCPAGSECGAHGRCVPAWDGAPYADAGDCASVEVALELSIPTVVLLIDQSSSMKESFGGSTRWEAVEEALVDPTVGVVTALESTVRFGATLYTSHEGDEGGLCPILIDVPPAFDNHGAIRDLLAANGPDGDTPTGDAIDGVVRSLQAQPEEEVGTPVIVLATDGEPDTCEVPDPQDGQAESVAAVQAAFALGIRTIALAVGEEVGEDHLQDVANAGAGRVVGGAVDEPFFRANDPAELAASFETILGLVRSCTFDLDGAVDQELADQGEVVLNGQALDHDDPDGWRLIDESTLEILGAACETFLTEPDVTLTAHFPCGAVVF